MTGQPFFLTMASISLSLAGLAGLLASFRQPSQPWTVTDLWRLRRIVNRSLAFGLPRAFAGAAPRDHLRRGGRHRDRPALFAAVVLADLADAE